MTTLEERYEKKQAELLQLKAQLDKRKARERAQEQKWRTQALIQIGATVLRDLGLDWKEVDPHLFADQFEIRASAFDCKRDAVDAKQAHLDWQDFKAAQRDKFKYAN